MLDKKFPLKKLSLTLACAWMSTPYPAFAMQVDQLAANEQWKCVTENSQWKCSKVTRNDGPLMNAIRPGSVSAVAGVAKAKPKAAGKKDPLVATAQSSKSAIKATNSLDWIPKDQLTQAQKAKIAPWASGTYIEPNRPLINYSGDPAKAKIYASSEESSSDYQVNTATFTDKVLVRQGYRQVESDYAKLYKDTNDIELRGTVVYREPNLLLTGDQASINTKTGKVQVKNAQYVTHPQKIRGTASDITRMPDKRIVMKDATYTSCPPGCKVWKLNTSDLELNPTSGRGTAKNAYLELGNVPVFYFPYLDFPIDDRRQSGFLYPTISFGNDNGIDYAQPYYFNLAPNYDATLTPRLMTERGLLLGGEFRYLTESSHGTLTGGYLNDDKLKEENRNYDDERWFYSWQHSQQLTNRWNFDINYADASDKDYFRDFGSALGNIDQTYLDQQFITHYQGGDLDNQWQLMFNVQGFENLELDRDDPYEKLPQVVFNGLKQVNDHWKVDYLADYTYFSRDSDWKYLSQVPEANESAFDQKYHVDRYNYGESSSNELSNADGGRMYFQSGVSYDFTKSYAYVRPSVKIRSVRYNLDNLDRSAFDSSATPGTMNSVLSYDKTPSTTAPTFSLDTGLTFERPTTWGGKSVTQTLEPRMFYVYTPHESGQQQNPDFDTSQPIFSYSSLWQDNRFSGYDRIGDANQVSVGLQTRILEEDGFERLRAGIGQTFYFRDRDVLLDPYYGSEASDPDNDSNISEGRRRYLDDQKASTSPIATVLDYRINDEWSWNNEWVYNTNAGRNERVTSMATWSPDPRRVLNLAYNYTNQVQRTVKDSSGNAIPGEYDDGSINQTDISWLWPVSRDWSLLGRWNYDVTNNRNLDVTFGTEQESDSYTLRLVWRNYVDAEDDIDNAERKTGVFVQFVLKGLGDIGTGAINSYLEDINGYKRREQQKADYQ